MIKESICQEDITTVEVYTCRIRVPIYIKQTLEDVKGKIENNTTIIDSTPRFQ